ncbi:hypothetical protein [Actinomadura rupiterrae]|uniref:hypothetical protein n=1 Tax=Actinomadura rupiterrae TaxID=559627 RepID=UPI0020A43D01|nr:hypothetical protein [Actinomadura rupiterrae]MCP2335245.1 hypothetical protein [Actinomadura rupiterrae]
MPDDDRFPRSLPPKWLAVRRAFERGDVLDTLSRLVEKALADTLRRIGGVPALQEISDEAHQVARARCETLPFEGAVPHLRRRYDRLPQTELTYQRTRVLLETRTEELAQNPETTRRLIAVAVVRAAAHQFGFGRFLPNLVDSDRWDAAELLQRSEQVLDLAKLDKLAEALIRHPDGNGLQAPRHKRQPIALDTPLEDV